MITIDHTTNFGRICALVDSMNPGECCSFELVDLKDLIKEYVHNDAKFTVSDIILENIVGSGYTHSYVLDETGSTVIFTRHEETGVEYYKSPDKR